MSNYENLRRDLIIRDKDSWDVLWQRAVAYYWDNLDACDSQKENKLFYILSELGAKNIVNEGNGIVAIKAFGTGPDGNIESAPNIVKVQIGDSSQREQQPKYMWQEAFTNKNSWRNLAIELQVKLPPFSYGDYAAKSATILSEYVALGLYFPFSEKFGPSFDYNSDGSESSASEKVAQNMFETPVSAVQSSDTSFGALNENDNYTNLGQTGDRGGSEGVDDDYRWLQFVPRLVAYNWTLSDKERIKPGSSLAEYPHILESLGFEIPRGLRIVMDYANYLPSDNGQFNINEYTSLLSIDFPKPPEKEGYNPIALADLLAQRGNLPFTSC
ncbi:hypothetical protein [Pseudoalteromonas byunsanensis]|uniref:Uncharacterized protein n=1 Tax=Pseudoalteromonas byunsanensis TaxID=327939 RepID=A0A1S1NBQ1_9GAMM|nr:hypothetical protein [Pseudoalteromonas byunsanensis]OHU95741.1 hypothetical protein BIW53_07885 [Pseudoalteromonas byunsanensis]